MSDLIIYAADLFCGAGGGMHCLCEVARELGATVNMVAVNHDPSAIATHKANFPDTVHYISDVGKVDPRKAVPGGYLDVLLAGPECIHFSRARGGKPKNKQSRANANDILWWLESLYVHNLVIENVDEFKTWGPLDENNKPIKGWKGAYFRWFVEALEELGYTVEYRTDIAANFGGKTIRKRLYLLATRLGSPSWAKHTHCPREKAEARGLKPWVGAESIIDLSIKGSSIYEREKPLSEKTMVRIYNGFKKHCGLPFILGQQSQGTAHGLMDPVPTVATAGAIAVLEPQLEPFLTVMRNGQDGRDLADPMPTITGSQQMYLMEPFLVGNGGPEGHGAARSIEHPFRAVLKQNHQAICEPIVVRYNGGPNRFQTLKDPLTTLDTSNRFALCEFVVSYYSNSKEPRSLKDPLPTVTTRDRFALVRIESVGETEIQGVIVGIVDILYRLLTIEELAGAQGFPPGTIFKGTKTQRTKHIGNSWEHEHGKAMIRSVLCRENGILPKRPRLTHHVPVSKEDSIFGRITERMKSPIATLFTEGVSA